MIFPLKTVLSKRRPLFCPPIIDPRRGELSSFFNEYNHSLQVPSLPSRVASEIAAQYRWPGTISSHPFVVVFFLFPLSGHGFLGILSF